jgi:RNA polymerase-binding transcription factor DksA
VNREPEIEPEIDLDAIQRDLEDVEAALLRLDAGTYWTDEVTGNPIDDAVLLADPLARRGQASAEQSGTGAALGQQL